MSVNTQYRVERIVIRQNDASFASLKYVCQISRRIKNATYYLLKNQTINGKPMTHRDADKWLKQNNQDLYRKLPSAMSQRMTQICGAEWKSYSHPIRSFAAAPSKFKARPRQPKYANRATTLYIGRNGFQITNGVIEFAAGVIPSIQTRFGFSQGWNAPAKQTIAQEVRIVPMGSCFVVELVYRLQYSSDQSFCMIPDKTRAIGIDVGINNLLAIASDQPDITPVLINGKPIKFINAWYNKRAAVLRGSNNGKHLKAIANKRYQRIQDYLHRTSRFVAAYCLRNDIGTVVIGQNKDWKQGVATGKRNNQRFVSIPHATLIRQLQYKLQAIGVTVIVREESYTSKAAALENDYIPSYGDSIIPLFSGKRIKRGLYSSDAGVINADINGALNILRKETGKALSLACRGCVCQPVRYTMHQHRKRIRRESGTSLLAA